MSENFIRYELQNLLGKNPFDHQIEFLEKCLAIYENCDIENPKLTGLAKMATGSGKTYSSMMLICYFWFYLQIKKPVIWITYENSILESQNMDQFPYVKQYGIKIIRINTNTKFDERTLLQYESERVLILVLRQSLSVDKIKKLPPNYFMGCIYDEVHNGFNSSNNKIAQVIKKFKQHNDEYKFLIGLSATPIINLKSQIDTLIKLFNPENNTEEILKYEIENKLRYFHNEIIFYKFTIFDALRNNIVLPVYISMIDHFNFFDDKHLSSYMEQLESMKIKKSIIRSSTVNGLQTMKSHFISKYEHLADTTYLTTGECSNDDEIFMKKNKEGETKVMFACRKMQTGTDISDLSIILNIGSKTFKKAYDYIQDIGRLCRKDEKLYKKTSTPKYIITRSYLDKDENKMRRDIIKEILMYLANDFIYSDGKSVYQDDERIAKEKIRFIEENLSQSVTLDILSNTEKTINRFEYEQYKLEWNEDEYKKEELKENIKKELEKKEVIVDDLLEINQELLKKYDYFHSDLIDCEYYINVDTKLVPQKKQLNPILKELINLSPPSNFRKLEKLGLLDIITELPSSVVFSPKSDYCKPPNNKGYSYSKIHMIRVRGLASHKCVDYLNKLCFINKWRIVMKIELKNKEVIDLDFNYIQDNSDNVSESSYYENMSEEIISESSSPAIISEEFVSEQSETTSEKSFISASETSNVSNLNLQNLNTEGIQLLCQNNPDFVQNLLSFMEKQGKIIRVNNT